jgi:predicted alpha/beta hydrolase family esterase
MKKVLFCHGKEGSPYGKKALMLRSKFAYVITPDLINSYHAEDFVKDWHNVETLAMTENPNILVGSSRGGAIVAQVRVKVRKLLIAPAWKKFGVMPYLTKGDIILHSKKDDLVPYEDSMLLANLFGCELIECGDDHRMSDKKTLDFIEDTIKNASKK